MTLNYYKPADKLADPSYVPEIEEVGGDRRIESRRKYIRAAGVTVIYYKYDKETKEVYGDQT